MNRTTLAAAAAAVALAGCASTTSTAPASAPHPRATVCAPSPQCPGRMVVVGVRYPSEDSAIVTEVWVPDGQRAPAEPRMRGGAAGGHWAAIATVQLSPTRVRQTLEWTRNG